MQKQKFYQWLDTVCDWMLLKEKPNTIYPQNFRKRVKELEPDPDGAPVVLRLHSTPKVCEVCSVITDTSQTFTCRRLPGQQHWHLTCNQCRRSYTKTESGYTGAKLARKPAQAKKP